MLKLKIDKLNDEVFAHLNPLCHRARECCNCDIHVEMRENLAHSLRMLRDFTRRHRDVEPTQKACYIAHFKASAYLTAARTFECRNTRTLDVDSKNHPCVHDECKQSGTPVPGSCNCCSSHCPNKLDCLSHGSPCGGCGVSTKQLGYCENNMCATCCKARGECSYYSHVIMCKCVCR
jgi:hypothetical protein